jgi:AraC family transcriptional regulator
VIDGVLPAPALRASTRESHEAAVAAVISHMRREPGAPLDLAAMASLACVSRWHFDRVFRSVTGISPRQFQTALRLNAASRLLLTTRSSVTEVCFDVGYESLGSFVQRFTETFGLSPQRLRELASVAEHSWAELLRGEGPPQPRSRMEAPSLHGTVTMADAAFQGLLFLGVFAHAIPIHAPLACSIVRAAGPFAMFEAPPHAAWLFAVALRTGEQPLDLLLHDDAMRAMLPIVPGSSAYDVVLRGPGPLDPPINLALPYLIIDRLALASTRGRQSLEERSRK